jgi:hypothetical protein
LTKYQKTELITKACLKRRIFFKERIMTNKKFWLGMAVIALAFSFVLTGCPADGGESDTWSKITTLQQMDGTWKGSFKYTTSISDMFGDEEDGEDGEDGGGMFDNLGDIKVTMTVEMTTTINATAKTEAGSSKTTMAFSGGKINEVWPMIKLLLTSYPEEGDIIETDEAKHSITITSSSSEPVQLTNQDIEELLSHNLQINQKGNKIKYPANAMHKGSPEIILSKQ